MDMSNVKMCAKSIWILLSLVFFGACKETFSDQDIDECKLQPDICKNGGTCANRPGDYSCICVNGWGGPHCETNIDDCVGNPCYNGGTCHDRTGNFHCECPPGKTGLRCHLDDACMSHPCKVDGSICETSPFDGKPNCSCPNGFVICETGINECKEDCLGSLTSCSDGWLAYHGSCYLFAHDKKSDAVTAEHYCNQHDGHLIHVETKRENDFIKTFLAGEQHTFYWIGISDNVTEGVWTFYGSDTNAPFLDWAHGQPDPNGDCAVYDQKPNYQWRDGPCDSHCVPLCEKPGHTDPLEIVG